MSKVKTSEARGNFKELLEVDVKPKIQKVQPTTISDKKEEHQLMVWIPSDLMVRLKTKTVLEKKSMKEIVTQLLEDNL